mmetsp:Transcript_449/g.1509  ORF Transcript_449/g.1509 Transcript_449/m.1509 type:complete len:347 (+) Transcript_449:611-1651(+)
MRGAPVDRRHVHGDVPAANNLLKLHGVDHASQQRRVTENRSETSTERPKLILDAVMEEPVHVGLHEPELILLRQLAVRIEASSACPAKVTEDRANVLAAVVEHPPQPVRQVLAHRGEVLEAEVPGAGRFQVVQEPLVQHAREDVGHKHVVEHRLAQENPACAKGAFAVSLLVEPVRALLVIALEEPHRLLVAAAVQEAPQCHLEELFCHARADGFLPREGHAERPPQVAVAQARKAQQQVVQQRPGLAGDLELQCLDPAHLQRLDLLPDVAKKTYPPEANRHEVTVRQEGAEVGSQLKLLYCKNIRHLRAGVFPPALELRQWLAFVDAFKDEALILDLGSPRALLV